MDASVKKQRFAAVLVAAVAGVLWAGAAYAGEIVRVGGTGSALGGMRLLSKAFEESHPGTKVQVFPSLGSSGGIKALLVGSLDLAVSGRQLKGEEQKGGAVAVEYARTPFVFAVNKSVTKTDISTGELEKIYLGQMLKWPDGSMIRLVLRPEGDIDTKIVKAISPAMEQAAKTAAARPGMIFAMTDQGCNEALVKTPGAIGPSTLAEIATEQREVQVLSYNGVKPTLKALANGSYPLVKPQYLVTTPKSSSAALEFVKFAASVKGRAILGKAGNFVPPAGKGN